MSPDAIFTHGQMDASMLESLRPLMHLSLHRPRHASSRYLKTRVHLQFEHANFEKHSEEYVFRVAKALL